MKKIAFVVVWMGKLPYYLNLWMKSCEWNPSIDFYLFSDSNECIDTPPNVKVINMQLADVRERIQKLFEFPICLDYSYKLCDYKPTYGEAFSDYLKEYDYWGYCDVDLLWGNIRAFVSDEILESHERLFTRGHCSLFKNNDKVNAYYRSLDARGHLSYKDVFQSDRIWCFDEWGEHCGGGISVIFREHNIATYDEAVMADIRVGYGSFLINRRPDLGKVAYFLCNPQKLLAYSKNGVCNEVLYCHFQKRQLKINAGGFEEKICLFPPGVVENSQKPHLTIKDKMRTYWLDTKRKIKEKI